MRKRMATGKVSVSHTALNANYTVSEKSKPNIFHRNSNKRLSKFIKIARHIRLPKLINNTQRSTTSNYV